MANSLFNITINDPLSGNVNPTNASWYSPASAPASSVTAYQSDAYNLLFSSELTGWEANPSNPYLLDDTVTFVPISANGPGNPTVGIGIDLHTNPGALSLFFNVSQTAQKTEYDDLSNQYASSSAYSTQLTNDGFIGFTITPGESQDSFEYYERQKENLIDRLFYAPSPVDDDPAPVVGSTARLALLDLARRRRRESSQTPTQSD